MIADDVLDLPAVELSRRLDAGELRSVELTAAYLARIDRVAPRLNCFITVTADRAREDAARADAERAAGRRGPLLGLPYAAKDAIDTAGIPTTWGTKSMLGRIPASDAAVIARLRDAGAVLLGKTSLTELCAAFADSPMHQHGGPCRNPWDPTRWSGGSSSGSAVAVATGLCAFALGTETLGSIDHPASCCGVTGFRPTYDLVPRDGVLALSWSLDKVGVMSRDARDARMIVPVLANTSFETIDATKLRVALFDEMAEPVFDPANATTWQAAKETLRAHGVAVEVVAPPDVPGREAMSVIIQADIFAAFEDFIRAGHADHLYDPKPWRTKLAEYEANGFTALDYIKATRIRTVVQRAYRALFERYDVIACFGVPMLADKLGEPEPAVKKPGGRGKLNPEGNLAGLPAITIPIGFTAANLPRSMQLVAAPYEDHKLFALAELFQAGTDFHTRRPVVAP